MIASSSDGYRRYSHTISKRSMFNSRTRFGCWRRNTMSCWRKRRFANPAEIRDALECAAEVFRGRLLLHHQYPLRGFGLGEQRQKTPPKASGRQRPHS